MEALSSVISSRWMLVSDTCSIPFIIYVGEKIRYQCVGIEGWMLVIMAVGWGMLIEKFGLGLAIFMFLWWDVGNDQKWCVRV